MCFREDWNEKKEKIIGNARFFRPLVHKPRDSPDSFGIILCQKLGEQLFFNQAKTFGQNSKPLKSRYQLRVTPLCNINHARTWINAIYIAPQPWSCEIYTYIYVCVYFFPFFFFYRYRSSRTPRKSQEHDHSSAPSILLNTAARWCAPILQQEYKFKVWDAIYHEFTSRHRIPKTSSRALHPRENVSRSLFFVQINSVFFFSNIFVDKNWCNNFLTNYRTGYIPIS